MGVSGVYDGCQGVFYYMLVGQGRLTWSVEGSF